MTTRTDDLLRFYPKDAEVAGLYTVKSDQSEFGLPQGSVVACVYSDWDPDKYRVCFKLDETMSDPQCNVYRDEVQSLESTIVVLYNKKTERYDAVQPSDVG